MSYLSGYSLFLMALLFTSVHSHSDHHNHIKDILYQHIPFLRTSTTGSPVESTTEISRLSSNSFELTGVQSYTVRSIETVNATEISPLQQGTKSPPRYRQRGTFDDFKERLGWSLGALISVPIVSLIVFCCFCYCLCKCCAAACSDEEKGVIVVQNQQPTVAPPIIVQNIPVPQMQPMQQYHPPPMQQYPLPTGPQFQPQLYQQSQYSPPGNYANPPYNQYDQPTAPPSYDTKSY